MTPITRLDTVGHRADELLAARSGPTTCGQGAHVARFITWFIHKRRGQGAGRMTVDTRANGAFWWRRIQLGRERRPVVRSLARPVMARHSIDRQPRGPGGRKPLLRKILCRHAHSCPQTGASISKREEISFLLLFDKGFPTTCSGVLASCGQHLETSRSSIRSRWLAPWAEGGRSPGHRHPFQGRFAGWAGGSLTTVHTVSAGIPTR